MDNVDKGTITNVQGITILEYGLSVCLARNTVEMASSKRCIFCSFLDTEWVYSKEATNVTKAFDPPAWNDKIGFLNSTAEGNSGIISSIFSSAR